MTKRTIGTATVPPKKLQLERGVKPAELAELIAAAMPDPAEQQAAAQMQSPSLPTWPWTPDSFRARLAQAREILAERRPGMPAVPIHGH
jgi:hypothetical protein